MKTILLTITERLTILNSLPSASGIIQSAVVHSIVNKVRFTSEEIDHAVLIDTSDSVAWDQDKPILKKVTFDNCEECLLNALLPEQFGTIREKLAMM